jgi:hypothetical protein
VESKSVSKSNNGIVTATAAAEEIHTAKVTHSTHDDSVSRYHFEVCFLICVCISC